MSKRGVNLPQQVIGLAKRKAATQKRYGLVTHVGSGTVSVRPNGSQAVLQRVPLTGAAKVGDTVELVRVGGQYRAQGSSAISGGGGAGQVILSGGGSSGGGGPAFPLAHAPTHAPNGSDSVAAYYTTPAAASTLISSAITSHVGQSDPHTQYLPEAGGTMTGALTLDDALNFGADVQLTRKSANVLGQGANDAFESSTYVSGASGFHIDNNYAEFGNIRARGEFHSAVFVKDLISAHAGTLMVTKSAGALAVDMVVPVSNNPSPDTWTMTVTNPPVGGFLFEGLDTCRARLDTGSSMVDVWFTIELTPAPVDNGTTQTYTCKHLPSHQQHTVQRTYPKGTAILDYGPKNTGYLTITADPTLNAPYYQVATRGDPSGSGMGETVKVRLGNLAGISDAAFGGALTGFGLYTDAAYLKGVFQVQGASKITGTLTIDSSTGGELRHGTGTGFTGSPGYTGIRLWYDSNVSKYKMTYYNDGVLQWGIDDSQWNFNHHILNDHNTIFKIEEAEGYSGAQGVWWQYYPSAGGSEYLGNIYCEKSGTTKKIGVATADAFDIGTPRITGDFSNATLSSRVMFQTRITNSATALSVLPSGTAQISTITCYNSSGLGAGTGYISLRAEASAVAILSNVITSGTAPPIAFRIGGTEYASISTAGISTTGIGVGITPQGPLHIRHATTGAGCMFWTGNNVAGTAVVALADGTGDVTYAARIEYIVVDNMGYSASGSTSLTPGNQTNVTTATGYSMYIALDASGAIYVIRNTGDRTFTVALWILYK